ncbi:MAG: type IV secretory system conjugative DNA transfer family protein [Hyphomicrobiaceae bacterium]
MGIRDWLKSDAERLGQSVPELTPVAPPRDAAIVGAGDGNAERITDRLPRGADVIRDQIDRKERARWARASEIAALSYAPGQVLLGKNGGRLIGCGDDKPMVTCASARSGKTATVLKPTLYTYPGSMLVLDPKGELARDTAEHRRSVLKQDVHILDPFGCSGQVTSPFNPLAELDSSSPTIVDDVDAVTQALILEEGGGSDGSHWTNSAQALLRGLILHALQKPAAERNLVTVRQLLLLTYPPLVATQAALQASGTKDPAEATQNALFMEMASHVGVFGGALAGAGTSFLRKAPRERSSIVSTAETQTRFLDSVPLQASLGACRFKLADLAEKPTTIYLCLPSGQMEKHFRWLRLIVRLALMSLERRGAWPRPKAGEAPKPPIIFLMEEFATLGHMPIMEQAAAYFPGFGVKLWCVLQDLGQLQRHYKAAWQTFLGNAGVLQFFGNGDKVTLDYISDRLGSLSFVRGKFGATGEDGSGKDFIDKERLLYPHETAEAFARGTGAQLLIVDGQPPMALERLSFDDVDRVKVMAAKGPAS